MTRSRDQRPRVLFFPLDMRSHILKCLQLADAVADRVEVLIGTLRFEEIVRQRGYTALRYPALSAELVIDCSRRFDDSWLTERYLAEPLDAQLAVIREHAPACVINDTSFTAQIAAAVASVPCCSLIYGLFSKHLTIARPVPRNHPAFALSKVVPQPILNVAEALSMRWMHRGVNRMRRKYGLPPRPDHLSEFEADFNFLTETQMFAPQGRLPPNFVQMGPVFHQSFGAETDVLDKLAPEKHTIFLNLGGTGNPESLRALTDPYFARYNILSVGWGPGQVSAPHIISREFLHLDTLLPRVDLVFTQGGVGNLFHSWSYGIPTICVPTFFEQEWNAARVVDLDLGAAFFSPPSREQVIDTVEKWIDAKNDARFKQLAASIDLQESKAIFRHHLLRFLKLEDTVVPN